MRSIPFRITAAAIIASSLVATDCAAAQEKEGLIPRLWRKFVTKQDRAAGAVRQTGRPATENAPAAWMAAAPVTKEEALSEIKSNLEANEDILGSVQEIKKGKDKDGKESYLYYKEGKDEPGIRLEDLDAGILNGLINKIAAAQAKMAQEQANEAIMAARQAAAAMEAQKAIAMQQIPKLPPQPPPQPPQQPPRPPAPPPQPPRR